MIILSRVIDLTGQRFGKLTVIEKSGTKNGSVLWKCKCDCGNYTEVITALLRNGSVSSCGCLAKLNRCIDIINQKFNRLTAIKYAGKGKWLCRCDCGNEVFRSYSSLSSGEWRGLIQNCGCRKIKKYKEKYSRKVDKKKMPKKIVDLKWVLTITITAFLISMAFSFLSETVISNVGIVLSIILLFIVIGIGVLFDMIGIKAYYAPAFTDIFVQICIFLIVLTFSVISEPVYPFPRVDALTRTPLSYIREHEVPSYLGSSKKDVDIGSN